MDIIQTLTQEIAQIVSGNTLYDTYQSRWRYLLESYVGGEEYRRAQHLTRYQLETDSEYRARLEATPLENHCQSVISVHTSFLFRKRPERRFGELTDLPEVISFLKDADYDGRSLDSFMKDVSIWSSVFGHCWMLLAKPDVGAGTRADEVMQGVRPYVNLLTPLVVLDWQWHRQPSGRFELDYFKYIEDVNGSVRTVKEWTKETVKTTVVNLEDNVINSEETVPNGLGVIPAVCCYYGRSPVRGIGVSAITDIADSQRFIYNATSEIDQSIRLDSHPSLVKTPETEAGIGAGSLIHMPDNLDPGLKPYVLDFAGASVDKILETIKHTIESIDKMANTGAIRATDSRTISGVSREVEFQLLNAKLSEQADNLELAEEQMWKLFALYLGREWDGYIDYPGSFNIRDTQSEVSQLLSAKQAASTPEALAIIDYRVRKLLDDVRVDTDSASELETDEYENQLNEVNRTTQQLQQLGQGGAN